MKKIIRASPSAPAPFLAILLVACGGGGGGARVTDPSPSFTSLRGRVFDGPIVGALVYVDVDENGAFSSGVDIRVDTTNNNGEYSGTVDTRYADSPLLAVLNGATDIGDPTIPGDEVRVNGIWSAPARSEIISPLTHLLEITEEDDPSELARMLNLPTNVDITQFDPYASGQDQYTSAQVILAGMTAAEEISRVQGEGGSLSIGALVAEIAELRQEIDALRGEARSLSEILQHFIDNPPTDMRLSRNSLTIAEGMTTAQKLADITFTDDELGTNAATLPPSTLFELQNNGTELWLQEGVELDFETQTTHTITLTATTNSALTRTFTLSVSDADEPPSAMMLSADSLTLAEGIQAAQKLADITFTDDALGTNAASIPTSTLFELQNNGTELWLQDGIELDFETQTTHEITLTATTNLALTRTFTLTVSDVDEPPSAMSLSADSLTLAEGIQTAQKLADITFTDDALGVNAATLPPSALFELRNNDTELWLQDGIELDFETQTTHTITLTATTNPALTRTFTLSVSNVAEATDPIALSVYENHPIHKDVYDLNDLYNNIDDFALTSGYGDNTQFELDDDGRIWFQAIPDHEMPRDSNRDNTYEIEVSRTEADSSITRKQFNITVQDITLERSYTGGGLSTSGGAEKRSFFLNHLALDNLPRLEIQEMLLGGMWSRTGQPIGPITLTWSLKVDSNSPSYGVPFNQENPAGPPLASDNQSGIDNTRRGLELSFAELENNANLKFIEVAEDTTSVGDISIQVYASLESIVRGSVLLNYHNNNLAAEMRFTSLNNYNLNNSYLVLHELLHSVGFGHPFESHEDYSHLYDSWPGDYNRYEDPTTLSSYYQGNNDGALLPLDIEVLQYLYGMSGVDAAGIESQLLTNPRARNVPPTALSLSVFEATLTEGIQTAQKLADVIFTDSDGGANRVTIPLDALFELRENGANFELWLKDQVELDFETETEHSITLTATINTDLTAIFTLHVDDDGIIPVDTPPTDMHLSRSNLLIFEGTTMPLRVADITFTDDGLGDNGATIPDGSIFVIMNGTELWLRGGVDLDFETQPTHTITLTATTNPSLTRTFTLSVSDVDEPPSDMILSATSLTIDEGETTAQKLADITFTDDALGDNEASILPSSLFEMQNNGTELWLRAGWQLDFETEADREQTITLTATTNPSLTRTFTLLLRNVDEPPSDMSLSVSSVTLDEGVQAARKLADITFTDVDGGSNEAVIDSRFSFEADRALFEIRGGDELWLQDGVTLDYETQTAHTITLSANTNSFLLRSFTLNVSEDVVGGLDSLDML